MRRLTHLIVAGLAGLTLATSGAAQEAEKPAKLAQVANAALQSQDFDKAAEAFAKLVEKQPKNAQAWHLYGYSLHALGKLDEALEIHKKAAEFPATRGIASYNAACVYALRKDNDNAIAWLSKAANAGFSNASHIASDPDMDGLRDDPRFKKIVAAISASAKNPPAQVFENDSTRGNSRLLLWRGRGSIGQIAVDFGRPNWKDTYDAMLTSERAVGQRWRLGQNFWTNLDTNLDLNIGGVEVPAGYYYLVVTYGGDDNFKLVLLDPSKVHEKKLDASQAAQTTGGIEVPLKHAEAKKAAKKLRLTLKKGRKTGAGRLLIHFGNHRLQAGFKLAL